MLINVALCKMSVGGVVASILRLSALGEICAMVSVIVDSMVFPRCIPRYLMCSGVLMPSCCRPSMMF